MTRLATIGFVLALAASGGCAGPEQTRIEPIVDTTLPTASVATTSTAPAPDQALVPTPAGATVVAPPGTTIVPGPGTTTVVPPPGTTTAVPAPATPGLPAVVQTLRAEDIKSSRVRAQTIYANRIEANEIRGVIHQDTGLRVRNTNGALTGPEIVASVIYADEIKADVVIADHIYVRDIRRR